jgi:hypothetical protein
MPGFIAPEVTKIGGYIWEEIARFEDDEIV